jgi:ribosomal-protein-alanine N-acetyltransferase
LIKKPYPEPFAKLNDTLNLGVRFPFSKHQVILFHHMKPFNFHPFPLLYTDRLLLRQIRPDDADAIFVLRSDEEVNKFVHREPPNSLQEARNHIQKLNQSIEANELLFWGINLMGNRNLIGTICLWNLSIVKAEGEIGFDLIPSFQRKGLMQEAVEAVLKFAFKELKLKKVTGWIHAQNERSISLLSRNNFQRDANAESLAHTQELAGMVIYSLEVVRHHS